MKGFKAESISKTALLLFVMSVGLAFSGSIWFDESYTLALIRHNYSDIIAILKDDINTPMYFLCLKLFCDLFGYSLVVTKIFSSLGFLLTLLLGCTMIQKDYGKRTAAAYELLFANIPMIFYFSTQQRCYTWSIFWVTLCFILGCRFIRRASLTNAILFSLTFLCSAYNHTYALIAVAGIAVFLNAYFVFKKRKDAAKIIVADLIIMAGYAPWMYSLLKQTKSAVSNFWQTSPEPLSLIVFVTTLLLLCCLLKNKKNRSLEVLLGAFSILFVPVTGFAVSLLIRPLYIARYAAPLAGIFALVCAICVPDILHGKRFTAVLLCTLLVQYMGIALFEYSPSISGFQTEFAKDNGTNNTFIYTDSSFGAFSIYYPENDHISFYCQPSFRVFENVVFVTDADSFSPKKDQKLWYVVNQTSTIPAWIKHKWSLKKAYSFQNDFNRIDVYRIGCQRL